MAGQWQVISKKKNKGDGSKKNKNQPQSNQTKDIPKMEASGPIQESQTAFHAFIEKEKKQAQASNKTNGTTVTTKQKEVSHKKKNQDKKKNPPPAKTLSLDEGIQALNCGEMKQCFATVEARFPESPMIWLQDLASYLNVKLDIDVSDPLFSNKPMKYPTSALSSEVRKLLISAFKRCTQPMLHKFFETCVTAMVHDMIKGLNTVGYRIILQCLSQEMPQVAQKNIPKVIELRNSYQNRQNVCLSILWVIGQAGNSDLITGFKVWYEVMFPILGQRVYSKHVVDYLETLTSGCRLSKVDKSVLSVRELFPILDFIHSSNGLSANLQKQLLSIYPKIKALSYGPTPAAVLRNYFPSYLHRLGSDPNPSLRKEVLLSLVECLTIDRHTYSVWRQLYTKHLFQSSFLIAYLYDEWENLPSVFPRKLLYETLSAFQVTNDELKGHARASHEHEVEKCVKACADLTNKMNAQRFPWGRLLFLLTVVIAAVLAYDIQQNGSFKKSKTGELMKDLGLLAICEQAWGKITIYTRKAERWFEVNIPVFSLWLRETFGPSVSLFWEKLFTLSVYVWNSTEGIRSWVNTTIPPILRAINDNFPKYYNQCSNFAKDVVELVANFMISFSKFMEYYVTAVITWLHQNVFVGPLSPDKIQRFAGNTVQAFQQYTMTTFNWVSKYIATVVYPGK